MLHDFALLTFVSVTKHSIQ